MAIIKYGLIAGCIYSLSTLSSKADYLFNQLQSHPSITVLEQAVVRQQQREQQELNSIFPDIEATTEIRKRTFEGNAVNSGNESDDFDFTLSGTFQLYEGYDYKDRARALSIDTDIASQSKHMALLQLWGRVHNSFLTARSEAKRIKVLDTAMARLNQVIREIEPVIQAGELPESVKYPLQESLLNFKQQKSLALETRAVEVQSITAEFPNLSHKSVKIPRATKGNVKDLTGIAFRENPQYRIAQLSINLADERKLEVSRALYPTVELYAEYSRTLSNADDLLRFRTAQTDITETEVGVRIILPFPYDPEESSRFNIAVTEVLQNQLQSDSVALQLRTNINRALVNIQYLNRRLSLLKKNRAFHVEGYKTTKASFKEGTSQAVDVSSRIGSIASTEDQIITVERTISSLYINLWTLIGRTP